MKLKFKSTTLSPKALLYRRFIEVATSFVTSAVYKTYDNKLWLFNSEKLEFEPLTIEITNQTRIIIDENSIVRYGVTYFKYLLSVGWYTIPSTELSTLNARVGNIAKYQTNKYYYVGSFDYVKKGSISGTTVQYIKGNIIPLESFNIKYFNDDINVTPDDLIVIDKKLYTAENIEIDHKHSPKDYTIYFATLNNIL